MYLSNKHHIFAESLKCIHIVGQLYTLLKKPISHLSGCLSCLLNFTGAAQSNRQKGLVDDTKEPTFGICDLLGVTSQSN